MVTLLIILIMFFILCVIVGYFFDKKDPSTEPLKITINENGKSIFNLLIVCSIILFTISLFYFYKWTKEAENLESEISSLQANAIMEESTDSSNENVGILDENPDNTNASANSNYVSDYYKYTNEDPLAVNYDYLKNINSDIKGWIKVNNTSINYPFLQSTDNDYYLHHTFSGSRNSNGWVFADYRNNLDNLDKNTVIYGHNLKNGSMFATLRKVVTSEWYINYDNKYIQMSTIKYNIVWEVFSVYTIPVTTDYIKVKFNTDSFNEFISMIKGRSEHDFGVNIDENDKILTLSTCTANSTKRIVLHAKLVSIEER